MPPIHISGRINKEKNNIINMRFPLEILSRSVDVDISNNASVSQKRDMIIFLGEDFRNLPGTDLEHAAKLTNKCLDYVRQECKECKLYYKPHPAETNEYKLLNLAGFQIMGHSVVELLFMKYAKNIRHVFSLFSFASRTAYEFGFNSSLFFDIVAPALDQKTVKDYRNFFSVLPRECFIHDLSHPLRENFKKENDDNILYNRVGSLIAGRNGTVWMLVGDPNSLPYAKTIDILAKSHNPDISLHLVIDRHHRWDNIPIEEVKKMFDAISFIPRSFYSLRPQKILRAWRAARLIHSYPIKKGDVIISRFGLSFLDDCFVSYFSDVPRVALLPEDFFNLACKEQTLDVERYRYRAGAKFFNHVLEPFLGIERTEYIEDKTRSGWNIYRYVRSFNDIFNEVWVYKG